VAEALAGFAAAVVDPGRPVPAGLTARPGADLGRRLAVYRNNVTVGLVDALAAGFPVTGRLVGEEFFRAMAQVFVAWNRPSSPMMFEYGAGFADFIAGFAPAASVPYLADVAALEAARTAAWHAAEGPALAAAVLARRVAGWSGEALLAARVTAHPATRVVASRYPIGAVWAAHQGDDPEPAFGGPWQPETALVTRPAGAVRVRALDPAAGAFAAALLAGASVGEAGAAALDEDEGFEAGTALVMLADAGAIGDLKEVRG
jgi:hypothetical protein